MKKKFVVLSSAIAGAVLIGAVAALSGPEGAPSFLEAGSGETWSHYAAKAGTAEERGHYEYWVSCLSHETVFSAPSSSSIADVSGDPADIASWSASDERWSSATLAAEQDVLMTSDTKSISLGDYASLAVTSIKAGSISLGTDASALDVTGFASDHSDDKAYDVEAVLTKSGRAFTVFAPTNFITRELTAFGDLRTYLNAVGYTTATVVYGNYRLANDVGSASDEFNCYTETINTWGDGSANGFKGILDGGGHTITGISSGCEGLFALVGAGATFKNLTIVDSSYDGAGTHCVLGRNVNGASFEGVTFKMTAGGSTAKGGNIGWISVGGTINSTFKNVSFDATGLDIGSLFGNNCGAALNDTFTNCSLTCKSLGVLGRNGDSADYQFTSAAGLTITLK